MRTPIPTSLSLLFLVLLPILFYWQMIVKDVEPVNPDTQAHKPVGTWAQEVQQEEGRMPEWFPYIFSGMPSYGSFLYIPRPGANVLGQSLQVFRSSRGARYTILFILAGISAFAFLRRQGASHIAATVAALGYSMTPYFTGLVAAGHSTKLEALAIAPLVFFSLDWLLTKPGPWPAAALAYSGALLAWANHPQISYYVVLLAVLYVLGRWAFEARKDWISSHGLRIAAYGAVAAAVAGALVTIPYLGIQEYAPYSIRGAASALSSTPGDTGVGWDYATAWSYPPGELLAFFFPAWYGLEGATYWGHLPFTQSTHYVGILFLLLAVLGLWKGRGPRRWIFGTLAAVLLLIGFGKHFAPLYRALYEAMPLFDKFRVPSMIYSLLPLAMAPLVAAGIDWLQDLFRGAWASDGAERPASGKTVGAGQRESSATPDSGKKASGKKARKKETKGSGAHPYFVRALIGLGVVLALWGLVAVGAKSAHSGPESLLRAQEITQYGVQTLAPLRAERMDLLSSSVTHAFLLLVLSAFVLVAASYVARSGQVSANRLGAGVGLAFGVLLVADLWVIDRAFYHPEPAESAQELLPNPGATEFLAERPGPFRILPLQPLFGSNSFVTAGLESVGGYQPAKLRIYQDLLDANVLFAPGVLAMLNVQYVLSASPVDTGMPPIYEGDGFVYDLPPTPGPVWSVDRTETLASGKEVLARLGDRSFDPTAVAYLEAGDAAPSRSEFSYAEVRLESRDLHRIVARSESDGPALIVFSEIDYPPAWHATVDGASTPILRVDHVLRAVEVPAGSHEIEMTYRSPAHDRASLANKAGLAALGVLLLFGAVLRRRGSVQ
ncbi:MAG: hypothetical protein H6682_04970 [Candidatus Eisenbacteria bacterium]|nr:hypothetical protein [Candidatus Eisenbacteria bacterium]